MTTPRKKRCSCSSSRTTPDYCNIEVHCIHRIYLAPRAHSVYKLAFPTHKNARSQTPPDDEIVEAFDHRLRRSRDRILVRSTSWRVTVGDIDDWSRLAAERVYTARLSPGSVVGLAAPNGPAFLAGFLALRRARCTALLLDHAAPAAERARVLSTIGGQAVLDCRTDTKARTLHARLDTVAHPTSNANRPDRAVIKMTSGSAGTPRGIAFGAEALLADEDALARTMGLREDDRLVVAVPMSHSYGFTTLALAALVRGLQLIMPSDAGPLAPLIAADHCAATVFPTVPAYLQTLLRLSQPPQWPKTVRLFITAGAPLPVATAAKFRERSGRPVHVFYGSSESGGICFDRAGDAGERGAVGTPVDGVRISLTAVDDPPGAGLLAVRSSAVGETYVPASNQSLSEGCFQTADLATWRNDEIVLLRRTDRVLNVRGFQVDPAEVERVLVALPGVDEVFVMDSSGSGGVGTLLRAVLACPTRTLDAGAVMSWCRTHLAEHKVPRSLVFVDALPRTSRGKIDRAALAALPIRCDDRAGSHVSS